MMTPPLAPPRTSVADPALARPDWTVSDNRDPDLLWLDKNENVDPKLAAIVRKALSEISLATQSSYPDAAGLYQKLADHLDLAPENLILSAGSDGVIRSVFEAFIDPGSVVLHTQPTFAMYGVYCRMYGADARAQTYRPSNSGPALTASDMVDAIQASSPKLVCLPNPDSPTGTVFSLSEMWTIIEAADNAGAVMLVDEAYYPFHAETVLPWVTEFPRLVVTRSTGKAWGLAGFRIGYGAASSEMAAILHKVRPMYETNSIAVAVFERMLDHVGDMRDSVKRLEEGKAIILDAMDELGFRTLRGQGNFLHVSFGSKAPEIHSALENLVYYRKDFDEPCLQGFSRFSSATPEQLAPIIARIRQLMQES
jgi:histidinol-phosphate aminotransferase